MSKHVKRRALATVVSTGILLSAVAIMGSMLTAWSNSIFANEQHQLNEVYAEGVNKLNEFLVIEHVWFGNNPSKFVNLTMTNVIKLIILGHQMTQFKLLLPPKRVLSTKHTLWGHETKKSINNCCWGCIFPYCDNNCC
jgi:hypothetical protein